MVIPKPTNERERLAALEAYQVLDSAPEDDFDDLVAIASETCRTPIALITLLDEDRQWFKARVGLDVSETARDYAFCAHAIMDDATLIVPDTTQDARFRENPFVVADPRVRFYAGAPLKTPGGHALGTLCVLDTVPRDSGSFTAGQIRVLEALSRQAVRLLELRRVGAELADALSRVELLGPLVPVCAWCKKVRDDDEYWSSVDEYLRDRMRVTVTHGICPSCSAELG